jgi:tetratricopeptide (TPR) repeat protein
MPDRPNKLTQFWNELKRRKVIKVIAMYAATAFIIMEAGDMMLPRLGLPDWTVTFIIVLLIIGFPIAIIFSWIFDITPQGLKKTEPAEEKSEVDSLSLPPRRGIKPSDAIIAVLIVIVIILVYPKIFPKDKFEEIRDTDGRISIAVMPFKNLTGDTLFNVWQGGFQNLLITTLSNSEELLVRQYQAIYNAIAGERNISYSSLTPSLASELALKLETRTFIIGNILKAGNKIRVNTQLINAETEEIYKTYQVDGNTEDDIFTMADSLSGLIRNYLEIRKLIEQYDTPDIRESFTHSSEALQCYFHGYNAVMDMDLQPAAEWLSQAIEIDSGFISAYVLLSITYRGLGEDNLAKNCCVMANKKRDVLPLLERLQLDHLNAYYFDTPDEQIRCLKQILEIDEMNSFYWFLLGSAYYNQDQYENAAINFEKVIDIHKKWGTPYRFPFLYFRLGNSYHQLNNHKRENEVYELGLTAFPDYPTIISYQATCALSQGDMGKANALINKYKSIAKNINLWPPSRILSGIGYMYSRAGLSNEAEMHLRQALSLDPRNPERMNDLAWFLIDNDINVDEGVDLIEKALELDPDDWYYLDTKGWGFYKQGKMEEALKVLEGSWDLRPVYDHEGYQHIQEVKKAPANRNDN